MTLPYGFFHKDYAKFPFPGFGSEGACFLRVRVRRDGAFIFLCAQLKNYYGTSITNAVEDIFLRSVEALRMEGVIEVKGRNSEKKALEVVLKRYRWIEHYPPGTGLDSKGSYAFVTFDNALRPIWNYVTPKRVIDECEVEAAFLKIPADLLRYER